MAFISVKILISLVLELSFFSLSHTLGHLRVFLEHSWRSVAYLGFGARRERKRRKVQEDIGIRSYNRFFL